MDRRRFLQFTGVASVAASSTLPAESSSAGRELKSVLPPVVMAPRHDGVEIAWMVPSLKKGYVEFGESEKFGQVARGTDWGLRPADDQVIKVKLDGLKTGTKYYYRTVTESFSTKLPDKVVGQTRSFTTLAPAKETTSFSVWNDTHRHTETIVALQKLTPKSDFLLWNGDISNNWYKEEEVAPTVLHPGGVDFTKEHPLMVLRGNHDMRGSYAFKFEDVAATPSGLPWFAFRSGPVAFICMDTGEDKDDDNPNLFGRVACEPMRQAQAEWLAKVIEQPEIENAPYKVVFCHIPLRGDNETVKRSYDHHSQRSRDLWHDGLVKWGAQVIVSGHTHRPYLLPATKNLPYQQLVGGGPKLAQATLITGEADANSLVIKSSLLDGKVLHEVKLKPLG